MREEKTREFIQGYAAALADFNRLHDVPHLVAAAMEEAGLTYHYFKDHGVEVADLGEIARCRTAARSRET